MFKNLFLKKYSATFSYFTMLATSYLYVSSYHCYSDILFTVYYDFIVYSSYHKFVIFDTLRARIIRLVSSCILR